MADILGVDDIASIMADVAPEAGDELVSMIEVWRMPGGGATPPAGGSGIDRYGLPVEAGSDPLRPDQKRIKVAEYPARVGRAGAGKEADAGLQPVSINAYTITFSWGDSPDIRGGDVLLEKVDKTWQASTMVALGDVVQPVSSDGYSYICTQAGVTGATAPAWVHPVYPSRTSAEIADGTAKWRYHERLRAFAVVDPGSETTYKIVRMVRAEKVH